MGNTFRGRILMVYPEHPDRSPAAGKLSRKLLACQRQALPHRSTFFFLFKFSPTPLTSPLPLPFFLLRFFFQEKGQKRRAPLGAGPVFPRTWPAALTYDCALRTHINSRNCSGGRICVEKPPTPKTVCATETPVNPQITPRRRSIGRGNPCGCPPYLHPPHQKGGSRTVPPERWSPGPAPPLPSPRF